ncbi:hypothetical protein SBA1_390010 [Candidatus Sulfotelmatobacter kueseliae]|uniref:Uncharacterized protein n=1 Tax=Candidatus Sulfotelmatobacter kueseliae TaxID=2042962 RepID=A0A2U3KQ53_9BACT|nr:hypothetical protein SBA1_390010 [Candidatus Sulfotelmatobacter kueseliae]
MGSKQKHQSAPKGRKRFDNASYQSEKDRAGREAEPGPEEYFERGRGHLHQADRGPGL